MTRHTLLLVDSDTQHARVIEVSLRKSGYEVVSARDGADALAKIESARPSMIISEVDMPNMSGLFCVHGKRANMRRFLCVSDRRQPDRSK